MSFVVCRYVGVSSRLCSRLVARWRGCLRIGSFLAVSCCLRRPFRRARHAHIHRRGEGRGRWAGVYAAFAVLLAFTFVSAFCRIWVLAVLPGVFHIRGGC